MGKIKVASNYSLIIEGKKHCQGEIVEVVDTSKYIGKKYATIIEETEKIEKTPKEKIKGKNKE